MSFLKGHCTHLETSYRESEYRANHLHRILYRFLNQIILLKLDEDANQRLYRIYNVDFSNSFSLSLSFDYVVSCINALLICVTPNFCLSW